MSQTQPYSVKKIVVLQYFHAEYLGRFEPMLEADDVEIHTDSTRSEMETDFTFEQRGMIDIQSKGLIETFWMTDRKTDLLDYM